MRACVEVDVDARTVRQPLELGHIVDLERTVLVSDAVDLLTQRIWEMMNETESVVPMDN